ncbi:MULTISPECIES: tyrosine-type recombinase/integrase [Acinetobacter]|uniref:Tyr recombinase domain-containing protein n=1 Tax=Acinetobacter variabilis TaxID=70346 RepID=N8WW11_9GAMM|nr:tyrosine-type recombinase/integrase [Acinetobacter variabilis]ENU99472.1 hypothetical protein F969_01527 [Acinetobacter variabilis]UVB01245.1 hypothetical protein ABWED_1973 [Acinetobacter lwoffii]
MRRTELKKKGYLADTVLTALEVEMQDYRLWDSPNLYFFVKANGSKSWQFRYKKRNGKWGWKGVGAYPIIKAKEARVIASSYLKEIEAGTFLEVDKYKLSSLIESLLDKKQKKWKPKTFSKMQLSIKKHIYPEFGNRDLRTIKTTEWYEFFERLEYDLKIPTQMRKLLSFAREAYDWASIYCEYKENPVREVQGFFERHKGGNFKFVDLIELPDLLSAIRSYTSRSTAIGLELLLLLFPRPGELQQAKWEQFDFHRKIWIKPAEIMKNKTEHRVPLSDQAIKLLKRLKEIQSPSPYLFPSRNDLMMPMNEEVFNEALISLGYGNKQHAHGFRHLASTTLNNKFSDKYQIIESALSHVKQGTKGIYDKAEHFQERVDLMQWWADHVYSLS